MNIIVGNIISFIGNIIDFIFNIKFNNKKTIVISNCFTSSLTLIAYIFLKVYDGIIDCVITLIRLIIIYLKDKYNKKCNLIFILFIGLYLLVFLEYSGIQTILLFLKSMLLFIPKWLLKDMQKIRISGLFATIVAIIYNIMIYNYSVISIQIVSIIFTIITIFKWNKNKEDIK